MLSSQTISRTIRFLGILLVTGLIFISFPPSKAAGSDSIFFEDFESGYDLWKMDGLWHQEMQGDDCGGTVAPFPSPTHAAYYGIDGLCDYNTGARNSGFLTLLDPVVMPPLVEGRSAVLAFSSYEEAEFSSGYDIRSVQVSTDGGGTWVTLGQGSIQGDWTLRTYDLTAYLGMNLLLRFHFDTIDASLNGYFGWMVDNILIFSVDPPAADDDLFTTNEDTSLDEPAPGVLYNDSVSGGGPFSVTAFTATSAQGAPVDVRPDGSFTYDPTGVPSLQALDSGDSRQDTFTYTIRDRNGEEDTATVAVAVTGVEDAPVANADIASTEEDVPVLVWVLSNDTDIERDRLVIFSTTDGNHGSVDISTGKGSLTYTPSLDYFGTDTFTYTVSDGDLTSVGTVTVTINSINDPPMLAPIDNTILSEGTLLAFTATASDPDLPANTLTYSLDPGAPAGASIDPTNGTFTWTPAEADGPGSYPITLRVNDNGSPNFDDAKTFMVTVKEVNSSPVLNPIGEKAVNEGEILSFSVGASDSDIPANHLTYSLGLGAPAGAGIDPVTGQFSWSPDENQGPGTYSISVLIQDDGSPNLSDEKSFSVTVNEINIAPELAPIGNKTGNEGEALSFIATASDLDAPANTLTFSLSDAPSGASINATTGNFSWTPGENQGPQSYSFTVRVRDNGSPPMEDTELITVSILEVNRPPDINPIGDKTVDDNSTLTFTASASDLDQPSNTKTFSLDPGAPAGASINPSGGQFSWTPPEDTGPGTYSITVRVRDNGIPVLEDSETIKVTVTEGNSAPVLSSIGKNTVDEGSTLTFTATASDSDIPVNTLTFSLESAPAGAGIDPNTGQFSWTPGEAQGPGLYSLTVRVTDNGFPSKNDFETIQITVVELNQAPVLAAIGDRVVDEGTLLSFTAFVTDPDLPANSFTYSLGTGAPTGASINSNTGMFTWTPSEAQGPGSYPVTVLVQDNGSPVLQASETFTVTVSEVNASPILGTIGDKSVSEGSTLTFTATASDSDNQPNSLTFSLDPGAPAGASINATTGQFTWTPTEAQGPGIYPVTVQVTDNGSPGENDYETITINVLELNIVPVLSPVSDQVVDEGNLVSFTAVASDLDEPANTLIFSLDPGAPAGASIDQASGDFQWTPTEAQGPGIYVITIFVRDGGFPELTSSQTVRITVNEVNSAPVARDDEFYVPYNSGPAVLEVLTNDSSAPDIGETLTITEASPATHGVVVLEQGKITYTPEFGYSGSDSFTYAISDGHEGSATAQVILTVGQPPEPPEVDAGADKVAAEGQTISFLGVYTSFGSPLKVTGLPQITWNFSDGSVSSGSLSPTHTYLENGLYTVTLTVMAENGGQNSDTLVVNVTNVPPTVNAGVDQLAKAGIPVNFSGTLNDPSPVDVHNVDWDFGDGQSAEGSLTASHTFLEPGTYTVTLSVTDDDGGQGEDTLIVTVKPLTYKLYLPVVNRPGKVDLQGSFKLIPQKTTFVQGEPVEIQVTITNAGEAAVSDFWVDFYINPSKPPSSTGPAWDKLCRLSPCYGIAWYVSDPLQPGSSVILTSRRGDYAANYTRWTGSFVGGTTDLYLLVDSWYPFGTSGAIPETNEANNRSELHGLRVSGSGKPPEDGQPPIITR